MIKNLFSSLLVFLCLQSAHATVNVDLKPRRVNAASIDLGAEARKQNADYTSKKFSLVQVDLKVRALAEGAMVALTLKGSAIDSRRIQQGGAQDITLSTHSPSAPAPWALTVRGQIEILQLSVTLEPLDVVNTDRGPSSARSENPAPAPASDDQDPNEQNGPGAMIPGAPEGTPLPPSSPNGSSNNSAPQDRGDGNLGPNHNVPPQQQNSDEIFDGQEAIVVSRSSGRIDRVTILGRDPRGLFIVGFEGLQYSGFERRQIAVMQGCIDIFCVSQRVSLRGRGGEQVILVARLPERAFVAQSPRGELFVLPLNDILPSQGQGRSSAPNTRQTPPPQNNRGRGGEPIPTAGGRRYERGQVVVLVDANSRVFPVTIQNVEPRGGLSVSSLDGSWQQVVPDDGRVGVLSGCVAGFCVGETLTVTDIQGRVHQAELIGIQSADMVVLRFHAARLDVGNWPARSLRR